MPTRHSRPRSDWSPSSPMHGWSSSPSTKVTWRATTARPRSSTSCSPAVRPGRRARTRTTRTAGRDGSGRGHDLGMTLSAPSVAHETKAGARRAARSPWIDRMARFGLAARGLVYIVIAWIAAQIAFGGSSQQADRQGAIHTLTSNGVGKVLVVLAGVGFAGYALWRLTQAIWGHATDDGAQKWGKRGFSLFRAGLYGWFAVNTFLILAGASSGGGSDQSSRTWSARLMGQAMGRWLVVAVGIGFIVAGAVLAWRGISTKFDKKLKLGEMSAGMERAVKTVGLFGNVARGVIFGIVGVFFIVAAATFAPHKARGLDGSLRTLADGGWGQVLLVAVAAGLAAFGLYSFAEARYRRTDS